MTQYCTKCGTKRRKTARFCPKCGVSFNQSNLPALSNQTSLSSFDPMRKLSRVIAQQQGWLRKNTLFRPLQELLDNVILHTEMERATNRQIDMVLTSYDAFTQERIEQVIDEVRQARRLADGTNLAEIKRRDLEVEDIFAQREHQRRLDRLREEHKHEKEVLELRAQLELVNAIIQSFNQVRMIQYSAQAEGLADMQQLGLLTQIIRQSFAALSEIDAGQLEYARRIKDLDFENLEDARSYQLMDELITAITDRLTKGVLQFGEQQKSNPRTQGGSR